MSLSVTVRKKKNKIIKNYDKNKNNKIKLRIAKKL